MKNQKEFTAEERKQLLCELRKKYNDELTEFCTELELALHVVYGGRVYRNGNELKIYLPNKQKYRIVVEPISNDK